MKKPLINYIIDALMFLLIIPIAGIGIIMEYVLPSGQGGGKDVLLGLTRHEWGSIHWYCSIVFVVLLITHIVLHWNWIKSMTKSFFKKKKANK